LFIKKEITMYLSKAVDRRSKQAMIDFLTGHFRYDTMNGWNRSTSYAHNIKLHHLGLISQQMDAAYDMLQTDFWDEISAPIEDFTSVMSGGYTIGTNGRSGGYLVLYQSQYELTGHLSYCRSCGQRNFKRVCEASKLADHAVIDNYVFRNGGCWAEAIYLDEPAIAAIKLPDAEKLAIVRSAQRACKDATIGNKCGACGAQGEHGRINYTTPPKRLSVYPGRDMDPGEDFSEWSMSELRSRVELVCQFDQACDEIRDNFIALIDSCKVVEEVVMVPKVVKRIKCCHA